jgi:hypothetical protein
MVKSADEVQMTMPAWLQETTGCGVVVISRVSEVFQDFTCKNPVSQRIPAAFCRVLF